MNRMFKKVSKVFILLLVLSIILMGCTSNKSTGDGQEDELVLVKDQRLVLGTFGGISAYSKTEKQGEKAIALAFKRIEDIENLMSTSIKNSDVYNINKDAGKKAVKINPSTMDVILESTKYYDITKKSFNIGLGSLIELWGIMSDTPRVPTAEEIAGAKKHINLNELEVSEKDNTVFLKDAEMLLDLGGIAKGYAVDEAVRILRENGINNGIVDLGGDIYALGVKSDGTKWRVGINNPEIGGDGGSIARILVSDKSVLTSGDYERYFIEDGIRYHHIIDHESGSPANNGVVSVTIVSDTSMDADVLATSALILGIDEGLQLIEDQTNVEGFLITKDREIYVSSGLKSDLEILDNNFKIVN